MAIDTTMVRSRRNLLAAALAGLAGAAAATLAGAERVLGAGDDGTAIHVAGVYADVRHPTVLANHTTSDGVLSVLNVSSGDGILATAESGTAIFAKSTSGNSVQAISTQGKAITAIATNATGSAVSVQNLATAGVSKGLEGQSHSPSGQAILGLARNGGTGLAGASSATFPTVTPDVGVFGYADTGRGGEFVGGAAQVRLVPSTATSHPSSGQAGDLFVDKSQRLWFCLGGTEWKRVQLV